MEKEALQSKVLELLKRHARMSVTEIAERLAVSEATVNATIADLEKNGVILGYTAVTAPEGEPDEVRAIIEVQVQPERDSGFDNIARRLARFEEVSSVYLVSGRYDLHLEVVGRSLQDVAHFVASKLASQNGVRSCATLFLLKKYKQGGINFEKEEEYERLKVAP